MATEYPLRTMAALDELLGRWRKNPDVQATLELCAVLEGDLNEELIREVGSSAQTWHGEEGPVMLAVGRLYLLGGLLSEAQAALVSAGKVLPADPRPFRFLGEVLLRRGDAVRSDKVLARAMQLGDQSGDTRSWRGRAASFKALQERSGAAAVAEQIAQRLPLPKATRAPAPPPFSPPVPRNLAKAGPRFSRDEEPPTTPTKQAPQTSGMLDAAELFSGEPLPHFDSSASLDSFDLLEGEAQRPELGAPRSVATGANPFLRAQRPLEPWKPETKPKPPLPVRPEAPQPPAKLPPPPLPVVHSASAVAASSTAAARSAPPFAVSPAAAQATLLGAPAPARVPLPPLGGPAFDDVTQEVHATVSFGNGAALDVSDAARPPARLVLEHLARVGVFEPGGGAPPAWERAAVSRSRGVWVLLVATLLFCGAGYGAYRYAAQVKADRAATAQRITEEVASLLRSGNVADLKKTDELLSQVFDLDSRSQRAARLWLENRVLQLLLLPEAPPGIDSAVHRARTVGLSEEKYVFGRVGSFLMEGDLAGAGAMLPKWDAQAGKDALYQLAAGAVLERAGDLRAIERYEAARALDPKLIPAEILLARLVLLELGADKGLPIVDSLKQKIGDEPTTRALSALAWAVDHQRPAELPDSATLEPGQSQKLPAPLHSVPHVIDALQAINAADYKQASRAIKSAITLAESPAMATQLGFLALEAGDEQVARSAALRALGFAAVYPQARVLAARVALLGGRIEEAQKAVEELEPENPEVAVVHAVVAYESLDLGSLDKAIERLGDEAQARADFAALKLMPGVLRGTAEVAEETLEEMAHPSVPWGELVAADVALDTGNLELAERLLEPHAEAVGKPAYILRRARLARYREQAKEAAELSERAFDGERTVPSLIERVYALLVANDAKTADSVVAQYTTLLGPMSAWLQVLIDAASEREEAAAAKVQQLDLPVEGTPLVLELMVARALAESEDKRAAAYARGLARRVKKHPDLVAALERLQK